MSQDAINLAKRQREMQVRILSYMYVESKGVPLSVAFDADSLERLLGAPIDEISGVTTVLQKQGLIKAIHDRGTYSVGYLSAEGVLAAQNYFDQGANAGKQDQQPSSVVFNNYGTIQGTGLQSGSGNRVVVQVGADIPDLVHRLLREVKDCQSEIDLSARELDELRASYRALRDQLSLDPMNGSLVREAISSIKTIIGNAAGSAAAQGIVKLAEEILGYLRS